VPLRDRREPRARLQALAEEFSLRCPRCGERGIYAKREIGIEDLPERRKKPRPER